MMIKINKVYVIALIVLMFGLSNISLVQARIGSNISGGNISLYNSETRKKVGYFVLSGSIWFFDGGTSTEVQDGAKITDFVFGDYHPENMDNVKIAAKGDHFIISSDGREFKITFPSLGFAAFAEEIGSSSKASKQGVSADLFASSLNEGTYAGVAEDKSEMDISLVKVGDSIKVKRLGYKFTGSMRVADVLMEDGTPFGKNKNGKLEFQFPVFVSFMLSSSLSSPSGKVGMAAYNATISSKEGKTICVLERIYEIAPEYKSLTMKKIKMEGGMPDGTGMLDKYSFVLKPSK